MKSFIQQEFKKLLEQKFFYPIRLYFQMLGFLFVSQCVYFLADSLIRLGEFQITWRTDWIYNVSFFLSVVYLITIIVVGKSTATSQNKNG